jgi:hypothetical protein
MWSKCDWVVSVSVTVRKSVGAAEENKQDKPLRRVEIRSILVCYAISIGKYLQTLRRNILSSYSV